jgi:hypothetical protein
MISIYTKAKVKGDCLSLHIHKKIYPNPVIAVLKKSLLKAYGKSALFRNYLNILEYAGYLFMHAQERALTIIEEKNPGRS